MRALVPPAIALWMTVVSSPVAGAHVEQTVPAPQGAIVSSVSAAGGTASARTFSSVFGYVWNAKNEPVARARVRLRNVTSGNIEATTSTTENGEFTFTNLKGGTCVLECVDEAGKVLAVGHVFGVAPGETVATFIRLGSSVPWFAALFGNAGAAVVASAASLGVTAIALPARPVSPER